MMKVMKVMIVMGLMLLGALNSQAVKEFARTYQRILEMNQARFNDVKKIPIGEIIFVPSRWDERDIEMIELMPPVNGQHDCIWKVAYRYVYGEPMLVSPPTASDDLTAEIKIAKSESESDPSKKSNRLWWLAILPVIPLTIGGKKWWEKKHNPNSYPPVGKNLDSLEPAEIVAEIQRVFEVNGDKVLEVKRGTLCRLSGPNKIKVCMKFGDNKDRNVWILPNESVCKIKIRNIFGNESYKYARSACTNGMVLDRFELPKGWEFQLNHEPMIISVREQKIEVPITSAPFVSAIRTIIIDSLLVEKPKKCRSRERCTKNKHRCRACQRFNPQYGKKRIICNFKTKLQKLQKL